MHIRMRKSLVVAALALLPTAAQQEYRLRVTVNLVQVDAIVTDSHGKPVSDLKADDFQMLLDGHPQTITAFNFIEAGGHAPATTAPAPRQPAVPRKLEAARPPEPTAPIKREDVRRSVVLFVDDLSMAAETVPRVRAGLRRFIEKQLQPGDLTAIVRASAGLGALQDFTTDRNLLLAAADHLRWNPSGRGTMEVNSRDLVPNPAAGTSLGSADSVALIEHFTVATTSSLWRLVHGMAGLPGRKSVVILSNSLPIRAPDEIDPWGTRDVGSGMGGRIMASMRRVVDESVRAGVVLYAIDTRGLSFDQGGTEGGIWASECIGGGPGTMPGLGRGRGDSGAATQNTPSASSSPSFPCGSAAYK